MPAQRRPGGRGRLFERCAAAFAIAAVAAAVARTATPFAHGWWLVAYLFLVGGVAQVLLGPGLLAIAARASGRRPGTRALGLQLVLWNAGTVAVAVADLASAPAGVLAGSALLLVALGSFASSLRAAEIPARSPVRAWAVGYVLLLIFLTVSVFTGAGLAGAL